MSVSHRKRPFLLIIMACFALATIAVAQPARAEPKNSFKSTCTDADWQTPGGRACEQKLEDDIAHNAPYDHFLICLNDGAHAVCGADKCCCQKGHGCTAAISVPKHINPNLLQGGPGFSRQGGGVTGKPPTGGASRR